LPAQRSASRGSAVPNRLAGRRLGRVTLRRDCRIALSTWVGEHTFTGRGGCDGTRSSPLRLLACYQAVGLASPGWSGSTFWALCAYQDQRTANGFPNAAIEPGAGSATIAPIFSIGSLEQGSGGLAAASGPPISRILGTSVRTSLPEVEGTAFQEFFCSIMELGHPGDFQRVRPWGSAGDRKNDGYLRSRRILFAVYGPNEMKAREAVAKIDSDCNGAVPHWQQYFDTWVFVHNSRDGLGPDITKKLGELDAAHPFCNTPLGFCRAAS
jgi:hypothetical protein